MQTLRADYHRQHAHSPHMWNNPEIGLLNFLFIPKPEAPDAADRSVSSSQYVSVDFQMISSSKMSKKQFFIEIWSKIDPIPHYYKII